MVIKMEEKVGDRSGNGKAEWTQRWIMGIRKQGIDRVGDREARSKMKDKDQNGKVKLEIGQR